MSHGISAYEAWSVARTPQTPQTPRTPRTRTPLPRRPLKARLLRASRAEGEGPGSALASTAGPSVFQSYGPFQDSLFCETCETCETRHEEAPPLQLIRERLGPAPCHCCVALVYDRRPRAEASELPTRFQPRVQHALSEIKTFQFPRRRFKQELLPSTLRRRLCQAGVLTACGRRDAEHAKHAYTERVSLSGEVSVIGFTSEHLQADCEASGSGTADGARIEELETEMSAARAMELQAYSEKMGCAMMQLAPAPHPGAEKKIFSREPREQKAAAEKAQAQAEQLRKEALRLILEAQQAEKLRQEAAAAEKRAMARATQVREEMERELEHLLKQKATRIAAAWDFFRSVTQAHCAQASELAFRLLLRRAGCEICWTPMLHADEFAGSSEEEIGRQGFASCAEDRPLVAQFCAKTPEDFLEAARQVQDRCDAVDLNLGCPQSKAIKGGWGGALMEEDNWHLAFSIVRLCAGAYWAGTLRVPVTCKIRIFADDRKTVRFAKMLEEAGCFLLTVHGRQRDRALHHAPARWQAIRAVQQALRIPVLANGGVSSLDTAERCLQETGCVGVMVATSLLQNPDLFLPESESAGTALAQSVRQCLRYLEICEETPPWALRWARDHLRALLAGTRCPELLLALDAVGDQSLSPDFLRTEERQAFWRPLCQEFRDVLKSLCVREGLCDEDACDFRGLPWGQSSGRVHAALPGSSLVVEGASRAHQQLLRRAKVSERFAERQRQKALAIQSCMQATSKWAKQ
ncbi:unnamed protein product [Effrenium voratum]|nr:unnamed protein product [Effrenium voratum]